MFKVKLGQLDETTTEKKGLENEYTKNQEIAAHYSEDIMKLKEEYKKIKQVITNVFDDELKSMPSAIKSELKKSKSPGFS